MRLTIPIIRFLCESIGTVINKSSFASSTYQNLKEVINANLSEDDYHTIYSKLKRKNKKGVELSKREYAKLHRATNYMNWEERFYIEFGNEMLEKGELIIDSLLAIRKLFETQIDFIKSILVKEKLDNEFEKEIVNKSKFETYLALIKNIVTEHVQTELNKLSAIGEDDKKNIPSIIELMSPGKK